MSYSRYGSIQLSDYITLHTAFYGGVWGTGPANATSQGYGQTIPTVPSQFSKVVAVNYWKKAITELAVAANHQDSTIDTLAPIPDTNNLIAYFEKLQRNVTIISNKRLNAKFQGTTSTTPVTVTGGFNTSMKSNFVINFQSADKARYFFNCGGQIYFNFSQTGGLTGDTSLKNLFNSIGDIYLSSAGEGASLIVYDNNQNIVSSSQATTAIIKNNTFTGITKVGGTQDNPLDTIQYTKGFYSLSSQATVVFKTSSASVPTLNLTISLSKGTTFISGIIEITGLPTETPTSGDTTTNVNIIKPSTTYLVDTWGTQTVSGSATGTTGSYLLVGGGGGGGYGAPEPYGGAGGAGGQVVSGFFTPSGTFLITVGKKGVGSLPGVPAVTSAGTPSIINAPLGTLTYPTGVYIDSTSTQNRSQLYAMGGSWPQNDKVSLPLIAQLPNKPSYASSSGGSGKIATNSGNITLNLLNTNKGGNAGTSGQGVTVIPVSNLVKQTYSAWPEFLNRFGVWYADPFSLNTVDFTKTINFPSNGSYTLTGCADNNFKLYIDGVEVLSGDNFQVVNTKNVNFSQGSRNVRIVANNVGNYSNQNPGGVAITIIDNSTGKFLYGTSYSTEIGGGGGGGGGAGSAGTNGVDYYNSTSGPKGGNGGNGISSNITGTAVVYGAGGGGGGGTSVNYSNDGGVSTSTGGNGGKGLGTLTVSGTVYGTNAVANTGSGGGGGGGGLLSTTNVFVTPVGKSGNYGTRGSWTISYLQRQDGTNGYYRFGSDTATNPTEWVPLLPSLVVFDSNNNLVPNNYRPDQWIVFTTSNTDWTEANLRAAGIDPTKVIKAKKVWISKISCGLNLGVTYAIGAMKKSAGVGSGTYSKLLEVVLFNDGPCANNQGGYTYSYNGTSNPSATFPCQGSILSSPDATYTLTNDDLVFTMIRGTSYSEWGWYDGTLEMGYTAEVQSSVLASSYTIDYLVVGGGGGGGAGSKTSGGGGGGGGGGGVLSGSISLSGQNTFTVKVGLGGVGGSTGSVSTPGGKSSFGTFVAFGGGGQPCGDATTVASTAGGLGEGASPCRTETGQGYIGGYGGYYSGGGGGGGGAAGGGQPGASVLPPPPPPPPPYYPPSPPPAPKPAPPPPAPSGGGGSCTIICTKLHELGYIPDNIYQADERFGEYLRQHDPYAYYGYIKWASLVVDWMNGKGADFMLHIRDNEKRKKAQQEMVIRWAYRIVTPWSQHMAYRMGVLENDNRAGKLMMNTGLYISRLIGKYVKKPKLSTNIFVVYLMWFIFGIFWIIAGVK